jgi:hypothetical protein
MYSIRLCLITDVYCDHMFRLDNNHFKENSSNFLFVKLNALHLNLFLFFWDPIEQEVSGIDNIMAIASRNT